MTSEPIQLDTTALESFRESLATTAYTSGSTHHFYHYPARFHPEAAREVIRTFSDPGDRVLDRLMCGETSIVAGLSLGRRMVGSDINALGRFVTDVRARPLRPDDDEAV